MLNIGEDIVNECRVMMIIRIRRKCIARFQFSWLTHVDPAQSFAESAFCRTRLYPVDTARDKIQWYKNKVR